MKKGLAALVAALSIAAYTPSLGQNQGYCYNKALLNQEGRVVSIKYVEEPEPLTKWEEILCENISKNGGVLYVTRIPVPSKYDGLSIVGESLIVDVANYTQQKSGVWKKIKILLRSDGFLSGFFVLSEEAPSDGSVNYRNLWKDLDALLEKNVYNRSPI